MSQQELAADERGLGGLTRVIHAAVLTQLLHAYLPNPPHSVY